MEYKRVKKPTRERILEAIIAYTETNGYPPTVREIGKMVGLSSTSTVHGHLVRLEKKGKIVRSLELPRTIRVVKDKPEDNKPVVLNHGFEIIEALGMLSGHLDERLREINKVRCDDGEVKFDIRTFAADYKCEDEGITLNASETSKLRDLLNAMGDLN